MDNPIFEGNFTTSDSLEQQMMHVEFEIKEFKTLPTSLTILATSNFNTPPLSLATSPNSSIDSPLMVDFKITYSTQSVDFIDDDEEMHHLEPNTLVIDCIDVKTDLTYMSISDAFPIIRNTVQSSNLVTLLHDMCKAKLNEMKYEDNGAFMAINSLLNQKELDMVFIYSAVILKYRI